MQAKLRLNWAQSTRVYVRYREIFRPNIGLHTYSLVKKTKKFRLLI